MVAPTANIESMPVIRNLADFDQQSGNGLERLIFNHRMVVIGACALITIVLFALATRLNLNASYEKMLPQGHPYVQNYLANKSQLRARREGFPPTPPSLKRAQTAAPRCRPPDAPIPD